MNNTSSTIIFSFDTDNCPDLGITEVTDILDAKGIPGTFFCTRRYDGLSSKHEMATHPFLNDFTSIENIMAPVLELKKVMPEAVGNRCHQLTCNGNLYEGLPKHGFLYDSSWPMLLQEDIKPIRLHSGLVELPIYLGEGYYLNHQESITVRGLLETPGLKIFLFHPVHIFHNTIPTTYQPLMATPYAERYVSKLVAPGYGVGKFFRELVETAWEMGLHCRKAADVAREHSDAC